MSTIFSDISSALDKHLSIFATANSLTVQWENVTTRRPAEVHLRQTLLPVETVQAELGSAGQDYTQVIYQIDVVAPLDEGKKDLYVNADLVADDFARGTILTYNTTRLRITGVERAPIIFDTDFVFTPVTITAETYTPAR